MPKYEIDDNGAKYEIDSDRELNDSELLGAVKQYRKQEPFDPDKYLAGDKGTETAFDPDAYLAGWQEPQSMADIAAKLPKKKGLGGRIAEGVGDVVKRETQGMYENAMRDTDSKAPLAWRSIQYPVQQAGRLAAIGTGAAETIVGETAKAVLPRSVKDAAKGAIGKAGEVAAKVPGLLQLLRGTSQYYEDMKQRNPDAAENWRAVAKIGEMLPVGKGAQVGGKAAFKTAEAGGKVAAKTAAKTARGAHEILGTTAEHLSDVPKETLEAYGWGRNATAKNIQAYAGKQKQIGDELLNYIDNIEDFMPEKEVVNEALRNMPSVNIGNTVQKLLASKEPIVGTPSAASGNAQIDKMIEMLISAADESGKIPAEKFRRVRMQIDKDINAAFNKDYKDYVEQAGINARNQMMADLETAAKMSGNPQYVKAMDVLSDKLQKVEKIKGYIGKASDVREHRVDSFIRNVFNADKTRAQEALGALSEVVDDDLLQRAQYAAMARHFGESGRPTLLSPVKTGSTMKGLTAAGALGGGLFTGNLPIAAAGAGGLALASPMMASKVLGTTGGLAKLLERLAGVKKKVPTPQAAPQTVQYPSKPLANMNKEELKELAGIKGKSAPVADDTDISLYGLLTRDQYRAGKNMAGEFDAPQGYDEYAGFDNLLDEKQAAKAAEEAGMNKAYASGYVDPKTPADYAEQALGIHLRKNWFGGQKGEIIQENLTPKKQKQIWDRVEAINTLHDTDYNQWWAEYGTMGFPDTGELSIDDIIYYTNKAHDLVGQLRRESKGVVKNLPQMRRYGMGQGPKQQ